MTNAWAKLEAATAATGGSLCVGVDPQPSLLPQFLSDDTDPLQSFGNAVIEATQGLAAAYKLNAAFFEAAGPTGISALGRLVQRVLEGTALAIVDAKRGDVAHTSRAYAAALFDQLGADAVTVNPYLGYDGLEPFLSRDGKGVFVLCRTSNRGAKDFQEMECRVGEKTVPLYLAVALKVAGWNEAHGTCGLVVGATAPAEVAEVRAAAGALPLLLPGVGAQGGDLAAAIAGARGGAYLISVSRSLIPDPLLPRDAWLEALRTKCEGYLADIRAAQRGIVP